MSTSDLLLKERFIQNIESRWGYVLVFIIFLALVLVTFNNYFLTVLGFSIILACIMGGFVLGYYIRKKKISYDAQLITNIATVGEKKETNATPSKYLQTYLTVIFIFRMLIGIIVIILIFSAYLGYFNIFDEITRFLLRK
jgi:hypothetical protein